MQAAGEVGMLVMLLNRDEKAGHQAGCTDFKRVTEKILLA